MTAELPYAPRRKRPLSLWNPLDYLLLLYWVYFFPQAIQWYVERFGGLPGYARGLHARQTEQVQRNVERFGPLPGYAKVLDALRSDQVQRNLVIQAIVLIVLEVTVFWAVLSPFGISSRWFVLVVSLSYAIGLGVMLSARGVAAAVTGLVAFGVVCFASAHFGYLGVLSPAWGAAVGAGLGLGFSAVIGASGGLALRILVFMPFGMLLSFMDAVFIAVAPALASAVNELCGSCMPSGATIAFATAVEISARFVAGLAAMGALIIIGALRLDLAVLSLLPALFQRSKGLAIRISRASLLPVPGLATRLTARLEGCWDKGLRECEGLLRNSLQFIAVMSAIDRALSSSDGACLLPRLTYWCDLGPCDWRALRYQSASLRAALVTEFWKVVPWPPRRWRPRADAALRYDTPSRAACAGFWYLHECSPDLAQEAFSHVRLLPFGEEMRANSAALAAALDCKAFACIGDWSAPEPAAGDLLRPGVAAVLAHLAQVARGAHLVLHSRSPRERNGALNRAIGGLKDLQGNLAGCPQPECIVVEKVVAQWLELALGVATEVGTLEAREPVASPYIVGAPVPADRLVGRDSVYDQFRSAWVKPGQRDSLIVYGHRRMGKTSVMKGVLDFCPLGSDTALAFLNLQTVDWSDALADLCQAIAFELWRSAGKDGVAPQAESFESSPLAALRAFFADLNGGSQQRRFILVLDEYELLDERLPAQAGTRFVELLRGLTQQYPWLVIALVGLHDLKERSASFYQAIFAWRPVRIGFLDAGGVADCLEVQDDAFPLAYEPEALAAVHRLTGGQPFLVQLLGDGLVQGFNRRLREEIRPPASRFSAADVAALTATGELFVQGAVYFLGIWGQAGTQPFGQQAVLRALAAEPGGLDAGRLCGAGLGEADLMPALKALADHDVLVQRDGCWVFTVELMRLWVASGQMDVEPGRSPA